MDQHQTAVTAGFVMEGLHKAVYSHVVETWGQGAYELVDAIMDCVPIIETLREAVETELGDDMAYPGVFDYEVSSPAGEWLGQCVIARAELPERAAIIAHIADLVAHFFSRNDEQFNDRTVTAILDAATKLLHRE